ncbi:hypothetical protein A3D77_02040 [Candidatus Gottesmanbacteria bacterium RIFCSPHIGHO2_02_FULL_39_11]|uniref:Uncharacterized protein n=1 Tax=Candidatus Gottesmanbacteria bacterium RIFCSPHIGHO2_02_FULL_39_11 TaxID=1798382 RepID=A0A1F5ZUM0_9BACT|nr:MAG: hypothetical protein A3D77_02040 [Candidatus Gottesmanbacteria bacterium RIFCSPHIGHO2_02_FULL_39_11]
MSNKKESPIKLRQIAGIFCIGILFLFAYLPFSSSREIHAQNVYLSRKSFSLSKRYSNPYVNDVMKKNILLSLAYKRGLVHKGESIDWNLVEKPFETTIYLSPGSLFSFHEDIMDKYKTLTPYTLNSHFNSSEGFISDGYLVGDGVCHLASLIYWAAKDAGLEAEAPTNHDFARIEEIEKEYGVAIYYTPGNSHNNSLQNLYIKNSKGRNIQILISFNGDKLSVAITE